MKITEQNFYLNIYSVSLSIWQSVQHGYGWWRGVEGERRFLAVGQWHQLKVIRQNLEEGQSWNTSMPGTSLLISSFISHLVGSGFSYSLCQYQLDEMIIIFRDQIKCQHPSTRPRLFNLEKHWRCNWKQTNLGRSHHGIQESEMKMRISLIDHSLR